MEGDQITSFIRGAIDAFVLVQCTVCASDDESVDDDDGRDDERQMKRRNHLTVQAKQTRPRVTLVTTCGKEVRNNK